MWDKLMCANDLPRVKATRGNGGMTAQLVAAIDARGNAPALMGLRNQLKGESKALRQSYPDQMREHLASDVPEVCRVIAARAKAGDRTCVRLFTELMGDLGGKDAMVQALVIAVGAQSPDHLKSAAATALDAEQVDDATAYAQAKEFCLQYEREHGLTKEGTDA